MIAGFLSTGAVLDAASGPCRGKGKGELSSASDGDDRLPGRPVLRYFGTALVSLGIAQPSQVVQSAKRYVPFWLPGFQAALPTIGRYLSPDSAEVYVKWRGQDSNL